MKRSIRKGVLPEMNGIHSLTDLIRLYEANGLLFQKRIRLYPDSQNYYKFISQVNKSSGIKRMALIVEEMKGWELPKAVQEHLESCKGRLDADTAADRILRNTVTRYGPRIS